MIMTSKPSNVEVSSATVRMTNSLNLFQILINFQVGRLQESFATKGPTAPSHLPNGSAVVPQALDADR